LLLSAVVGALAVTEAVPQEPADLPVLSVGAVAATVTEGPAAAASFTVRLSAASDDVVSVDYATRRLNVGLPPRSALPNVDFTVATGSLTFAAGRVAHTVVVTILDDELVEDTEPFELGLRNPVNATLSPTDQTARVTIEDDDVGVIGFIMRSAPWTGDTHGLNSNILIGVEFNQAVAYSGSVQLALTIGSRTRNATLDPINSSATEVVFRYTVQAEDQDTDGFSIAANAISLNGGSIKSAADSTEDAILTHAARPADASHKVDGSLVDVPTVSSISISSSPAGGDTYEFGETIQVEVIMAPLVAVTRDPQLALTIGSQTRYATLPERYFGFDRISHLYFEYTVQAGDADSDGISIAANAISLNGGSFKASADGTTDADMTHSAIAADSNHKVDGSVPTPTVSSITVSSSPASGDTYLLGETIQVAVEVDAAVTVTGSPQVALTIGSRTRHATLGSRAGSTLHFAYNVQAEDVDTDGISIAANSISLNGGTVKASADGTTDADLTHAAIAADSNHKVDGTQVATPTVRDVYIGGSPANGDTYERGERIVVFVEFSQPVTITGGPRVALTIGSRTRHATDTFVTQNARTRLFAYTVQAEDVDTDGISIPTNSISLNDGSIKAAADGTTAADLTHTAVAADPKSQGGREPAGSHGADGEQHLHFQFAGERRHLQTRRDDQGRCHVRPTGEVDRHSSSGAEHRQRDQTCHSLRCPAPRGRGRTRQSSLQVHGAGGGRRR